MRLVDLMVVSASRAGHSVDEQPEISYRQCAIVIRNDILIYGSILNVKANNLKTIAWYPTANKSADSHSWWHDISSQKKIITDFIYFN